MLAGNSAQVIPGTTTISFPIINGHSVILLRQTHVTAVCDDGKGSGNGNENENGTGKVKELVMTVAT